MEIKFENKTQNQFVAVDQATDVDVPLTIGYLSSYLSSKMTLGAIPLAIETVNADPSLLPGRKLQFVAADIGNPGKKKPPIWRGSNKLIRIVASIIFFSFQLCIIIQLGMTG